jgi:hypothetical protein
MALRKRRQAEPPDDLIGDLRGRRDGMRPTKSAEPRSWSPTTGPSSFRSLTTKCGSLKPSSPICSTSCLTPFPDSRKLPQWATGWTQSHPRRRRGRRFTCTYPNRASTRGSQPNPLTQGPRGLFPPAGTAQRSRRRMEGFGDQPLDRRPCRPARRPIPMTGRTSRQAAAEFTPPCASLHARIPLNRRPGRSLGLHPHPAELGALRAGV